MNKETIQFVKCPTCQKDVEWSDKNIYRPFCCKRCQLIDLGEWANEEHRIADNEISEQDLWSEDDLSNYVGKH
ncbi:DNA gyrase inhibitor YacG [Gilliamella apicola]|uniref:DNA gyrase inhibitor YacG n=1 Tax=Gilliamella apicola TaxID=1196095 RepID=UPI000A336905|nr:DNA gyrase inhibitor YacG [Gilliamella apicola]OTQ30330.1 DNA gyrase inhibitor YacG [Gilliamella apicola]OTQ43488.1 DNA gyrase inhibitor YacG [Gilliamella apicola]